MWWAISAGTSDGGKQHRNGGSQGKTACGSAHQLHLFRQRQARDVSIDPQVEIKIARQGQNAGERFCKYRNHNPSAGGCDFYVAASLRRLPRLSWPSYVQEQVGQAVGAQGLQPPHASDGQQNVVPEGSQVASSVSAAAGDMVAAPPITGRQGTIAVDASSINLVASVANLVIGVANLILLVAAIMMRVLN
ncbi:uncharacterized protein LOC119292815 [Triticum dicoccoides]|uniref:uncharacterized protein LOC119292815 n=1 Tax=Triticum dicoccoides TaxID=85692 RepID=UPI0018902486|nr:uncharacterized protein LOC119292815 [Triticum dicoccoides]XP_044367551.1 uncharacterized protein LOC123090206 [Triticum aestivum]